jgi:hypothetical protein
MVSTSLDAFPHSSLVLEQSPNGVLFGNVCCFHNRIDIQLYACKDKHYFRNGKEKGGNLSNPNVLREILILGFIIHQ